MPNAVPDTRRNINLPPFIYYLACFFLGAFISAFLTIQITKDNYTLDECFLVHEAVENEPKILGSAFSNTKEVAKVVATQSAETANTNKDTMTSDSNARAEQPIVSSVGQNCVNINSASLGQLDSLPGIGPAYAQRIIDNRPFSSTFDIQRVKGIGPKTYEKIKELICLE